MKCSERVNIYVVIWLCHISDNSIKIQECSFLISSSLLKLILAVFNR